jgi:hypothetical protein
MQRLLTHADLPNGDALGRQRLARRTAQAIRQRAYVRGWLTDRYVPNPVVLGYRSALFLLARPYSERARATVNLWRSHPRNVVLWASPELLFGVFFSRALPEIGEAESRVADPGAVRVEASIRVNLTEPSVPVYFDFEAAWTGWTGLPGTLRYPRPLPTGEFEGASGGVPTPSERNALGGLLVAPFLGEATGRGPSRFSRLYRSERRWLRSGQVEYRSFLNPQEVTRWVTRFADQAVFVFGELLRPGEAPALFHALVSECRVGPFLFVTDGRRVLWGALSGTWFRPTVPAPVPRAPVLPTVEQYMRGIRIVREGLSSLEAAVDHRYERLLTTEPVPGR